MTIMVLIEIKGAQLKIFITSAALYVLPVTAMAADLGLRKTYLPGADTPVTAASPWTGAYAGVNAGGGFGRATDPTVTPVTGAIESGGVLGGVQVGYNQQVGGFVLGLEADYALAHARGGQSARTYKPEARQPGGGSRIGDRHFRRQLIFRGARFQFLKCECVFQCIRPCIPI